MKPDLVILACGGTGRELAELASSQFNVLGFLDDAKSGPHILGKISDYEAYISNAKLCSGLGSYRSMPSRKKILDSMPLDAFINYVASDVRVYPSSILGRALTIFPGSIVSTDAQLGNHCHIYHNAVISHDAVIGAYTIISNSVTISGNVVVGENCYLGAGSTVLEGITIGNNSIVAAGATVVSDIEDGAIYLGPKKVKVNHYR